VYLSTSSVLVIGYGNTLRSDDSAGQIVAQAVKTWELPNVRSLAVHQLTPELAEILTTVKLAIFVDAYPAAIEQDEEVKVRSLKPASSGMRMRHTSNPEVLLAIAQALYNYYPQAWLVAIPGENFELGNCLSPLTQCIVEWCVRIFRFGQYFRGNCVAR
jgi:hydrogenase maturation protease